MCPRLLFYRLPFDENPPGLLQDVERLMEEIGGRHVECIAGGVEIYVVAEEDQNGDPLVVQEIVKKGWHYETKVLPESA